ncbi:MAG: hypothetical protein FWD11_07215 [Micrococcales bacterium]|nr:hypothetical protein [Micrococcales bacterium]
MQLDLYPFVAAWAYDHDVTDANLISFSPRDVGQVSDGFAAVQNLSDPPPGAVEWDYLMIQRGVCIDPDEEPFYALPHVELDDQSGGDYYDVASATFFPQRIEIDFAPRQFADKYSTIAIHATRVPRGIVEFFVNGLYLGDRTVYSDDFPDEDRVEQTEFQEILDDDD